MIGLRLTTPPPSNNNSNASFGITENPISILRQNEQQVASIDAAAQIGGWIEDWMTSLPGRVASYIYSKLPSFSLPGAYGSTVCNETPECRTPTGSYTMSCHRGNVTFTPPDKCTLTAYCETGVEEPFYKRTSIEFDSETAISALNVEGTLKQISSHNSPVDVYRNIAASTGGSVVTLPSPESFKHKIEETLEKILQNSGESESIDIAFVIDTTQSMSPYLKQAQDNLGILLQEFRKMKDVRVAVVEYRDKGIENEFLTRVTTHFTSYFELVKSGLQDLKPKAGFDLEEAGLDAILAAKKELWWREEAYQVILLVTDAAFHPKTADNRYDESDVIDLCQGRNIHIAVYPVVARRVEAF